MQALACPYATRRQAKACALNFSQRRLALRFFLLPHLLDAFVDLRLVAQLLALRIGPALEPRVPELPEHILRRLVSIVGEGFIHRHKTVAPIADQPEQIIGGIGYEAARRQDHRLRNLSPE